jgi:hypothetical protein
MSAKAGSATLNDIKFTITFTEVCNLESSTITHLNSADWKDSYTYTINKQDVMANPLPVIEFE